MDLRAVQVFIGKYNFNVVISMKFYPLLLLTIVGALATSAAAQDLVQSNRILEIGADSLYRSYQENFPAGVAGHDREGGTVGGVQGRASWMGDVGGLRNLYLSVQGAYDSGQTNYRGTVFNTNTPLNGRNGLANGRVRVELGKGFRLSSRLILTPVFQTGFQRWERDLPGSTELYDRPTVGAGLRADYALASRWTLKAHASVAEMISPQITFQYAHDYTTPLGARAVYEGGLGVDYALTARWRLTAEADASRYGYGQGPVVSTVEHGRIFEPASTTTDAGLRAGLAYGF